MKRTKGFRPGGLLLFAIILALGILFLRTAGSSFEIVPMRTLAGQVKSGEVDRLIIDMDELEVIYLDGSLALAQMEPYKTLADHLYAFGLTDEDLASASIQIEVKQNSIFNQKLFLGVPIGGFVGLLIVSSLVFLYFHMRTNNPIIYL